MLFIINGELFSDVLDRDYGLTKEDTAGFFKGKFSENEMCQISFC